MISGPWISERSLLTMFHYTGKDGWNAVRAQAIWRFKAAQPRDPKRRYGVYFTDIEPTPANLRTLYKRIRIPKAKQEYVFWFDGDFGLRQPNDGRGRDKRIWFSPIDYDVEEPRQRYEGATEKIADRFS